jgi:hypothetical protein
MRIDPATAVTRAHHRIVSLVASFAVAMTMVRFGAAHAEAERARRAAA